VTVLCLASISREDLSGVLLFVAEEGLHTGSGPGINPLRIDRILNRAIPASQSIFTKNIPFF
jgi:hypothetical protein